MPIFRELMLYALKCGDKRLNDIQDFFFKILNFEGHPNTAVCSWKEELKQAFDEKNKESIPLCHFIFSHPFPENFSSSKHKKGVNQRAGLLKIFEQEIETITNHMVIKN